MKRILINILYTIGLTAVAGTPTYIFLIIKHMTAPEGFWQNVVVYGLGLYILGAIQLVLFGILIIALIQLVWDR